MRRICIMLVLVALAASARSATRSVTPDELQGMVADALQRHLTDDLLSQKLNGVRLESTLDTAQWQALTAESPGLKTTEALRALYASAAFLEPAAAEIPAIAPPDVAGQRAIISRVIGYVLRTIPALPNLLAVRDTAHYTDTGVGFEAGNAEMRGGLLLLGEDRTPVSIRDGVETDAPVGKSGTGTGSTQAKKQNYQESRDLISWGEFGPVLTTVLTDAAHGKLGWARWQTFDGKQLAVFQFSVARTVSHYSIHYCCDVAYKPSLDGLHQAIENVPSVLQAGYHGFLMVDPETGVIRRITIEADIQPGDSLRNGSMMIEWGAVTIGSSQNYCPMHSVTLSTTHDRYEVRGAIQTVERTRINETEFEQYHRFGSQARLVTDVASEAAMPSETKREEATPAAEAAAVSSGGASSVAAADSPALPAAAAVPVAAAASKSEGNSEGNSASKSEGKSEGNSETNPEMLVSAVNGLPGADSPSKAGGKAGDKAEDKDAVFTVRTETERVDVSLVAYDKHDRPVTDLRRDEIEIYDNGKRQEVDSFQASTAQGAASATPSAPAADAGVFSNAASAGASSDTMILLLDASHLPFDQMDRAREQVMNYLKSARPGTVYALYALDEHGFQVIQDVTRNQAVVLAKLAAWQPSAAATAQALERRDRQQFDTVHNAVDLNNVNGNYTAVADFVETTDPELMQMGDNPQRQLLAGMLALARHFAPVDGHKSLALISGDSALSDWEDRAVGIEKSSRNVEAALMHAREALNNAHIALYVVDASSNLGGAIDANIEFRNVELNQGSTDNNGPAGASAGRNLTPGRVTAQMESDQHGIDDPVRQLAEATGGRAIRRGVDVEKTLDSIQADEQALYELSFAPATEPDNTVHTIVVKVRDRKGLKLRYRTSYLDSVPAAMTARARLDEAVWSPQDASAISITAEAVRDPADAGTATVRLRIALNTLALEEQTSGPSAGRWTDQLFIFVAERNDGTRKAQISGDTLALNLLPATYQSYQRGMPAGIPYKRTLALPAKLGSVRIVVVDRNSGRVGSVTVPAAGFQTGG